MKYLFIATIYNKFDIYCVHPEDQKKYDDDIITKQQFKKLRFKISFMNGIYQTNSKKEAEALMEHPHYGSKGLFILDNDAGLEHLKIEDEYGVDKPMADRFNKMKVMKLKSIANEKELAPWQVIKKMTKTELIKLMIRKKGLLEEYAT